MFMVAKADCTDSPTWACTRLKKLWFVMPGALVVTGAFLQVVRGGLVAGVWGMRATVLPQGLRLIR